MTNVTESIDIDVPAERVFWAVTDPETLPRFLSVVKSLEATGPDTTRWTVEIAGRTASFDARATDIEPPHRARYQSESPRVPFVIEMRCDETGPASTRLSIETEFDAGGMAEKLGLAKPIAKAAISSQLKNAKQYLERRFAGGSDAGV